MNVRDDELNVWVVSVLAYLKIKVYNYHYLYHKREFL